MPRHISIFTLLALALINTSITLASPASTKFAIEREEKDEGFGHQLWIPYAFSTESMGTNLGLGYVRKGFYQPQMTVAATVFGGDSEAYAVMLNDFRLPYTDRLYLSALGMYGDYPKLKAYALPQETRWPSEQARPGSNDSSNELFIESQGQNNWMDVRLEFVLPIGSAKKQGWMEYKTRGGLLSSDSSRKGHWNPLTSGVSVALLRRLWREQIYESELGRLDAKSASWQLGFHYDNSDFPANPSTGTKQFIAYTSDNSPLKQSTWDFIEAEHSQYMYLGQGLGAKQRVLAVTAWAGYSPSWQVHTEGDESYLSNTPIYGEGATLGGFDRMRGFDSNRFSDKAALYLAAEYRHTLDWNPADSWKLLRRFNLDWLQVVAFAESGRVHSDFNTRLLQDMHQDIGVGLRAYFSTMVGRLDFAVSNEQAGMWLMVGQSF
ncbi:hypothetical protein [Agaribacterium sp. ZY112]|uniref:hypothetical protein n=1 Tax=Agaribacterium sp. ZY112 TaxID=3233574 RepID=UPI003523E72E